MIITGMMTDSHGDENDRYDDNNRYDDDDNRCKLAVLLMYSVDDFFFFLLLTFHIFSNKSTC